jgi:hypothetical protein
MKENTSYLNTEEGGITRRQLFKKALRFGERVGESIALGSGLFIIAEFIHAETNIVVAGPSVDEALEATAEVAKKNNWQTTLETGGIYTQEFLYKIRNGTFAMDLTTTSVPFWATCWCASRQGNIVRMVTCDHVVTPDNLTTRSVDIFRPYIDKQKIHLSNLKIVKSNEYDIAVLQGEVNPDQAESITPLNYRVGVSIKPGMRLLVVGYPSKFRQMSKDDMKILTSADTVTVRGILDKYGYLAYGSGIIGPANSGSPAAMPDEFGNPVVIGVVTQTGMEPQRINWREIKQVPIAAILSLNISSLM